MISTKYIVNLLICSSLTLLMSCGAESMYSGHQCYFIFSTEMHPSTVLTGSITGDDGFCLVYKGIDKGVNKVFVEKYGTTDENSPYAYTTSIEPTVESLVIGWDNGLLIGYSAIEGKILAFDRHCPRCENSAKAKLQWYKEENNDPTRNVKCPVCGTPYNLSISGNGLELYYNATYDGRFLRVVNGR